jgi:histidinol-phosphate/aromatic aminotransferase/cobyric acid decarboxylase-like protein
MLSEHGGDLVTVQKLWGKPDKEVTDYSVNLNLFAPEIPEELWASWRNGISSYPPLYAAQIEEKISEIYNLYSGDIIATNGAMEALEISLRIFHGKQVCIPCPCFNEYITLARHLGLEVIEIEQTADTWQTLDFTRVRHEESVVLLGNPGNPTGKLIPYEDLVDCILSYPHISWIIDEAFIEFTDSPSENSLFPDIPENCIVVRSLTKLWSIPGIRLGFLTTPNQEWIQQIRKQIPTWNLGWLAHAWSNHFLEPGIYEQMRQNMQEYTTLRSDFSDQLNSINGIKVIPSTANYLLLQTGISALKIAQKLWNKGYAVRTMHSIPEMDIHHYLRICIRDEASNTAFAKTLEHILHHS